VCRRKLTLDVEQMRMVWKLGQGTASTRPSLRPSAPSGGLSRHRPGHFEDAYLVPYLLDANSFSNGWRTGPRTSPRGPGGRRALDDQDHRHQDIFLTSKEDRSVLLRIVPCRKAFRALWVPIVVTSVWPTKGVPSWR
jgi:hypothetical protein